MKKKNEGNGSLKTCLKGLTGITENECPRTLQEQVSKQHVLMTGLHEPPSYFVYILMGMAGFTPYSDWDKSRWQFYVQYKDIHFCLRDWKMSTWTIDALEASIDKESVTKIAEELRRRIVKTSRSLEKFLQPELRSFIDENNYALPNPYRHLRNLYDYFRSQVQETQNKIEIAGNTKPKDLDIKIIAEQKTLLIPINEGLFEDKAFLNSKSPEPSKEHEKKEEDLHARLTSMVDHHNNMLDLERIASYNACAMVSFFFSYIEFLMDILYIFYPVTTLPQVKTPVVNMTLHDFQEKSWRERFNTVFPVNKDKELGRIYRKLLEIRDGWRNVIEHGFRSKEEALLIPLPGLGLVPISYTSASETIHFALNPSPKNGIQGALDVFSSFDTWAAGSQQIACVVLFAQSDSPIPLMEARLQEIRGWMSSPEALKKALETEEDELQSFLDQYQ